MKSVLETCRPRREILTGSLNPEVFTASLSPVIEFYRSGRKTEPIDEVYIDAGLFFREATYPTQGLRLTLAEVFRRLAGDATVPAIHRLETAFGGGKTHTLIACTHVAYRGKELRGVVNDVLAPELLPEPGSVTVVGVAGDKIPVHKPRGNELVPYTLWGEIAYQVGGEKLYRELEDEASSPAAPGKTYFHKVFGERKVVVMLDELAQYAARLEAARPDGASQLAAFLLALHDYARTHLGVAVVLTLASARDAFARQTECLAKLISEVRGEEVDGRDALDIGERAVQGVSSVVARDAVQVTPVHAGELSSILAKRLFESIDREAARVAAAEYVAMYRRNASMLPEEASRDSFRDRMVATYPFHPTLIDFLNKKLAAAENFQGTRGVLRVLSLAVQDLWQKRRPVPMIHACHLDLRSDRVANEVLGRTGSSDLLFVLNADVGGPGSESLEGGASNAELLDRQNPHPEGHLFFEYTWKTVFLHSLVGREEGLQSKVFGLTEPEALFSVSFPGLTPPQVRKALEGIRENAFYLRQKEGKYFASKEPTIPNILAAIRKTITKDQVEELLKTTARKVVTDTSGLFHLEHDVSLPEHVPDGKGRPVLAVVSPVAEEIDVEAMVTTKGPNRPREQQNLVFLLVPDTVRVKDAIEQLDFFRDERAARIEEVKRRIEGIARQVKAMRMLAENPQRYGVSSRHLEEEGFKEDHATRENDLVTAVAGIYTSLYHPSADGRIARREIRTGGGEGGMPFIEQIREMLLKDGELLTATSTTQSDLLNLSKLFFEQADTVPLERLRSNFQCVRSWPVLEKPEVFELIVRAGVQKGAWCLYRMGDETETKPAELYHQGNPVPMRVDLSAKGYALVTVQGANKRGWMATQVAPDPAKVRDCVARAVAGRGRATVQDVRAAVEDELGEVREDDFDDAMRTLLNKGKLLVYPGKADQAEKPDRLVTREAAATYVPESGDVLITPARAAELGWITERSSKLVLSGKEGAERVIPLLRRLGSIYSRGAKSTIDSLDLMDLGVQGGGTIRIELQKVTPAGMRALGEFFEVLAGVISNTEHTEVFLEIGDPDEACPLVQELRKR